MAAFGTLDECRHGQAQIYFPYCLLGKDPQFDWAHKAMHTNEWGVIAARSLFDDMFTANDAVSTAIQLTFTFETGFTNLQFLGMDVPWYWEKHFLPELDWVHHAYHMGVWFWRPTVWWNPDAGVSAAERDWLEQKYPGWNDRFGKLWDVIGNNVRTGQIEKTYP